MSIPRLRVGTCIDCGKELFSPVDEYRVFNSGKIKRCEECCQKQGIKKYVLKDYESITKD